MIKREELMAAKINYEDNIFFLNTLVSTLNTGLSLDIDPEYFRDKIVEDIFFVDVSLKKINASLNENSFLIRRPEYLRSLLRVVRIYNEFLSRLLNQELGFSDYLESYFLKLRAAASDHDKIAADIDEMLQTAEPLDGDEDFVSQDEFRFLLKEEEVDNEGE